eukprot:15469491-Alexandrium_andersonii.AAC.1
MGACPVVASLLVLPLALELSRTGTATTNMSTCTLVHHTHSLHVTKEHMGCHKTDTDPCTWPHLKRDLRRRG